MLFSTFFNLGAWIDYQLNLKEYKAKCENLDKPDLKCDGKCHLKAMFQVEEKQESKESIPVPVMETYSEIFVYFESIKEVAVDKGEKLTKHLTAYFFSNIENDLFDLFVPPKVDAIN